MNYAVRRSSQFKRQYKKLLRSGNKRALRALQRVIKLLVLRETLPLSLHDHELTGALHGLRECHMLPDWLLIYSVDHNQLVLELFATGTHSELFR